jgi:L-cystine uptake protein TcyP (sodium:dicarboxylate symporter family)
MADHATCHEDDGPAAEQGHAELLGQNGDGDALPSAHRAAPHGFTGRVAAWVHEDPLLALTLLGVAVGISFGLVLTLVLPGSGDAMEFRDTVVKLVSLPGKMFLNLLKMMVLPLISGSMIAGVCALKSAGANTGKLARVAFTYFAATTLIAVVIGLVVVNVVQPGA